MFEFSLDFLFYAKMYSCNYCSINVARIFSSAFIQLIIYIYIWFFTSAISICDTTCQIQAFFAI